MTHEQQDDPLGWSSAPALSTAPVPTSQTGIISIPADPPKPPLSWPQAFEDVSGYVCITLCLLLGMRYFFRMLSRF